MKYYLIFYKEKQVGLGKGNSIPIKDGAFSYKEITKYEYVKENINFYKLEKK